MLGPGFAHNGNDFGFRLEQSPDVGIFVSVPVGPAGGSKRSDLGVLELFCSYFSEKLGFLFVGQGKSPLDIVDLECIELQGDLELILQCIVDACALHSVSQGCVVDCDVLHGEDPCR